MSAAGRTIAMTQPDSPRGKNAVAFWVFVVLFVVGAASFVYALGRDDPGPNFALLTVTFLYLMGVSQAGVVFSSIMRIVGAQWSKPYHRLGEFATLAFAPFAVVVFVLLFVYARGDLFLWLSSTEEAHMSPWLSIEGLLIRDLLGLLLFYGISIAYALKALKPDLTSGAGADHRAVERELRTMSPLVIIAFVICNTLFAWDFGMMLIEHWYSTVFPIFFTFGNLFAGTAALVLFVAVLGRGDDRGLLFGVGEIRSLGMVVTGFTLIWLYLFWAQFFVIWFGNLPRETDPMWRQMYGHYAPYYWTMMSGCFFVPFVAFVFALVKRSLALMCVLAVSINVGIWLNKYLTVVPVFSPDDTPFDSWLDVSLSVGLGAGFLAVLVWLMNRWPRYSRWELELKPETGE